MLGPFYAELARATEDVATARGYTLVVVNTNAADIVTHIQGLASRQVHGVLIASDLSTPEILGLRAAGIRLSLLNQLNPAAHGGGVGSDLLTGTRAGVAHLIEHGHTRIAFVGELLNADERLLGWQSELLSAGLSPHLRFGAEYSRAAGYRAGRAMLANAEQPTAVFVSSDMQAVGVLRAMHEGGVAVPGDMAIVSLDGSPESEYSWPALTTLRQPVQEMAVAAVAYLLGDVPVTADHLRYPLELIIRQSCGCPLVVETGPAR